MPRLTVLAKWLHCCCRPRLWTLSDCSTVSAKKADTLNIRFKHCHCKTETKLLVSSCTVVRLCDFVYGLILSNARTNFPETLHYSLCWTSPHPGLHRLHFFYHRPWRAKSWVSPRPTGAMVPPKFHLRFLLHARPSFRQLPCGSRSGVGTIVQRNEDFVDYTAGTSLSGRRLLLAFAFTKLNFDKE